MHYDEPTEYFFVVRKGLYLCIDKRWTERLCFAFRTPDWQIAADFAEWKKGEVKVLDSESVAIAMRSEMSTTVLLAMNEFSRSITDRN